MKRRGETVTHQTHILKKGGSTPPSARSLERERERIVASGKSPVSGNPCVAMSADMWRQLEDTGLAPLNYISGVRQCPMTREGSGAVLPF